MSSRDAGDGGPGRDPILGPIGETMRAGGTGELLDPLGPSDEQAWDALAAGHLGPVDRARLRAQVSSGQVPEAVWEAMQPLSDSERDGIVDAMFAAREVIPIRAVNSKKRRGPAGGLLLVATIVGTMAAGLVVALRPSVSPLPEYSVAIEGGEAELRGPAGHEAGPVVLGPEGRIRLIVTPDEPMKGEVEARLFTVLGAEVNAADVVVARRGDAFLVEARRDQLFPPGATGEAALLLVAARPGHLPELAVLRAKAIAPMHADSTGGWKLLDVADPKVTRAIAVSVRLKSKDPAAGNVNPSDPL